MKKDLVSTYIPKVYKSLLWIASMVIIAIIANVLGHAGEVFYATQVGPDQVNDNTTSYFWIDNFNNIKNVGYVLITLVYTFFVVRVYRVWVPKKK